MPSKLKFGVVVFPGSNCDYDTYFVLEKIFNQDVKFIWHKDRSVGDVDVVILPGGFSYGDYLRPGAIARFSPIMEDIIRFANRGGKVLGICNGFQVLVEAGLLPGALLRNSSLRFVCKYVYVRVENNDTFFTSLCDEGEVLKLPIAHGDGNYYVDDETLKKLIDNNQIVFRYCDRYGNVTEESNPNGSIYNIAGVINEEGNVLGMMPHPERCSEPVLGCTDGAKIFNSLIHSLLFTEEFFK
ncbi:phosphoribosylformylglycinamidine synthase subunit I [Candidatus Kryptonium thompsonii]|jgi:phosphoribosylformylglycinamidine synthase|uniref:Phosphoribosylformylglycinamidine synthase subunit PurQ n=1 Tax=Candidatus Kryptonium thompsonii TaxID=1633631 RepID=A0A0P1LK09_9BACT|nr:phosphoribosylformylglycinamidine synthase subunit PurQ [Candidatus Kryptonium thompsoni]CUS77569.1 phosphoribosylformylglycinamidine synthase subunit I [Candidatus Kryptonium thompsoni]CUS77924.1 phosphoribosylformylglycinamidine synthase subunit I [Candidatus Kryptonium thompsoni]CUS81581.1 phosphoribosylformylglycinamidine synthase subunit I [Candidatus Kryptonium thompsoni]CUS87007.1 phosphoribosylformylglycinamidine synthase subunit I [Candidatus Kryptonium thompsoni]CUS90301.1 phospho